MHVEIPPVDFGVYLINIVSAIAADDLVMEGSRISAAMVLT